MDWIEVDGLRIAYERAGHRVDRQHPRAGMGGRDGRESGLLAGHLRADDSGPI